MLIKFIRGTALGGIGNDAAPGDVRDLPDQQARMLCNTGRAVPEAAAAEAPADAGKQPKQPKKAK